jgi:hypothetical protein
MATAALDSKLTHPAREDAARKTFGAFLKERKGILSRESVTIQLF